MALLKKFAGETVIYGVGSILPRVLFLVMTPLLTNTLDTGEYGDLSVMYAFAALLLVFFTYGMETGLFRFGSKDGQLKTVFSTAAISLLCSTLFLVPLLIFFSENIAVLLEKPNYGKFVRWFILIVAFDALAALPFAKLRLENRPIRFASIKILNVLIQLVLICFFLLLCPYLIDNGVDWINNIYSKEIRLDLVFLANLIASIVVFLFLAKDFFSFKWEFDRALWKRMLIYALPLILVGFASVVTRQMDRIFLTKWLPQNAEELTGIYSAGVKIAVLMSLFITAFNYAAEPFFFKNKNRKDSRDIYAKLGQAFAIVGSLGFLGILLYIDWIQILIGKDFREGLEVVPVLLLAYFGLGLFYNFSIWYKLTDRTRIGAWISMTGASITILINYIFIPTEGIMAPAYAALACYIFMATVSYLIGKKYYPIDYPIGRMLMYIFTAVGVYLLSTWIRPYLDENLIKILVVNTLLFLSYLGGLYLLEKDQLKELLKA